MNQTKSPVLTSLLLACAVSAGCASPGYRPANLTPPPVTCEFRGVWVATVDNIDWPSKKDLSTAEQKAELLAIIEGAARLKLNAIIFQVRPQCDAIYPSQLEPWSEFLTGQMGRAPQPAWDPLAFAIEESHRRGIELHAWFNPYRALHPAAKGPVSANHVSRTRPQLVRSYGKYLWLDPGEREVQDYSLAVVMDVVKRYDVDGIHFDDYFYPYKEKSGDQEISFPDDASWNRFGAGGKLSREDWRRENVNQFVERVGKSVHAAKPWVKFGISPFGIWRPGNPPQIKGYDAYEKLYADSRKWLRDGSVDYFAPQLYWGIESRDQSFPVLLNWWNEQNPKQRHIWPGLATSKLAESWKAEEIIRQIRLAEKQPVSAGNIQYSVKHILRSSELQSALARDAYADAALPPACPWLQGAPAKPQLKIIAGESSAKLNWQIAPGEKIFAWVVQLQRDGKWSTRILSGERQSFILDGALPEAIALTAVSRAGVASKPEVQKLSK
ncbi:MAG: hypothetical protein EPO07_14375 [Verrucomicrobia bacterium]|nr:MAG: hypothetical protein EPO07_14375 [Verrucomicrobiota bacterium]